MTNEEWRPVVGYEGLYEVSDCGRVRSLDRVVPTVNGRTYRLRGVLLKSWSGATQHGHRTVSLSAGGVEKVRLVHQLVLESFVGPRPAPGMHCCHFNGDPADNRVSNLRWDTPTANQLDKVRHGRHHNANKTTCPYGHLLATPNLTPGSAPNNRACRSCANARGVGHKAKKAGRPFDFLTVANQKYAEIMAAA